MPEERCCGHHDGCGFGFGNNCCIWIILILIFVCCCGNN